MGLLHKITKIFGLTDETEKNTENMKNTGNMKNIKNKGNIKNTDNTENMKNAETTSTKDIPEPMQLEKEILFASSFHITEDETLGEDDTVYRISFKVNDAFKEAKSHAGEIELINTYAPMEEYGREGSVPYLAIQLDDEVYVAVEEFKERGTFTGAIEITALSGKFYFKAKMEYYGYFMYFYGLDRCNGFWENNGLCMVYPKAYANTENERKLMKILDEAAESYREERLEG